MGIARSEIRHMIEHMAKLMVQEADSWANTYGPEARLCPTCGHPTMGGDQGQKDSHAQVYANLQQWKMFYYGQLLACDATFAFGVHWCVTGASDMDNYEVEAAVENITKNYSIAIPNDVEINT